MKRGKGQGRLTHGAWRAAQYRNDGNSISRVENVRTTTQHLQYKEIIAGMGYEINRKHQTQNHNSSNKGNNKEEEGDNHNSDIEHTERRRAAIDSACWFVPHSGNMTQDRPEGVFQLAGGNLNSASSKDVREWKISNIHCIFGNMGRPGRGLLRSRN
jgi:hypothetical protein